MRNHWRSVLVLLAVGLVAGASAAFAAGNKDKPRADAQAHDRVSSRCSARYPATGERGWFSRALHTRRPLISSASCRALW
jgi:hypothetical protein